MHRLRFALAAALTGMVLLLAGPASAHVNPDPPAAQAGTTATIQFTVEHGCDDSPTTMLAFKIPAGVTGAKGVDKTGWQSALSGDVLTFSGGSQDAHTAGDFSITMTFPTAAGTIYFPVVQTCAAGSISWIAIPQAGQAEPDHPAAAFKVTVGPPTADDLKPVDTGTDDATATHHSSSSHTGLVVGIIVGAVVILGAGGFVVVRRRR